MSQQSGVRWISKDKKKGYETDKIAKPKLIQGHTNWSFPLLLKRHLAVNRTTPPPPVLSKPLNPWIPVQH